MTDREWIMKASYKDLLARNRFSPIGDPIFIGVIGQFFMEQMAMKKSELSAEEHVRISKQIGWDNGN